jgi:hypothetical protein
MQTVHSTLIDLRYYVYAQANPERFKLNNELINRCIILIRC